VTLTKQEKYATNVTNAANENDVTAKTQAYEPVSILALRTFAYVAVDEI